MLTWLRDRLSVRLVGPRICLGYGRTDRFRQAHRMLAGSLPVDHVEEEDGGHHWDTGLAPGRRTFECSPFEILSVGDF